MLRMDTQSFTLSSFGTSRPRGLKRIDSEALEENDELNRHLKELDEENHALREREQDLEHQLRIKEEELRVAQEEVAKSRAAQQRVSAIGSFRDSSCRVDSFRNGSFRNSSSAGVGKRGCYTKNGNTEALIDDYESAWDTIEALQAQLAMAEEQLIPKLEDDIEDLSIRLQQRNEQHAKDTSLARRLEDSIQDLQRTLASERQKAKDSKDTSIEHAMSQRPRSGTLADELSFPLIVPSPEPEPWVPSWQPCSESPPLRGYLLKRCPTGLFGFRKHQRRFFAIENGKISWWKLASQHPDQGKCLGSVDLLINQCLVELDSTERDKFRLRSLEQVVVSGLLLAAGSCGTFTLAEFRKDLAIRYTKDRGVGLLYWLGRWYLGPDTNISNAVASRDGPDTLAGLTAVGTPWTCHLDDEHGSITVMLVRAWEAGSFTGAQSGRMLEFCTNGSEHTLDQWVEAVREQIEVGCRQRQAIAKPTSSMDSVVSSYLESQSFDTVT